MALDDVALVKAAGASLPQGAKVTPMLRQWLEAKAKAPDAVLLFRMGDFYELFADDAERAGPLLDLVVTTRDRDKGDDAVAMAGFPHHAAPAYIARLVQAGLKVAVCDQLEDPALAKGIVKRDVTRIVTPGMVLDDESLDAAANNYLLAVVPADREADATFGVAALDLSTGSFVAATFAGEGTLLDEVARFSPREVVLPDDGTLAAALEERLASAGSAGAARRLERRPRPRAKDRLLEALGTLDRYFDDPERLPARAAAELVLAYVRDTQGTLPGHLGAPRPYSVDEQLLLDATTRRHLDLTGPPGNLRAPGTLAGTLDVTLTAPGGRQLLRWLIAPSTSEAVIAERHDKVGALVDDPGARRAVREALRGFYDVERLTARLAAGRATPREIGRLRASLERLPEISLALERSASEALRALASSFELLGDVRERLARALVDDPPLALGAGPVFRAGHDAALDELVTLSVGGRDAIAQAEERERQATGIPNLKVKYTRVFGYYIEVTKTHLSKVPEHYRRKQTVANAERYVTEELARLEEKVATAETKRAEREASLFEELRQDLARHAPRFLRVAERVAELDALCAFAEVSDERRYTRPRVLPAGARRLSIRSGRHPVVEAALAREGEAFVPSDVDLDADERQVVLVTGPNMAGKSTLMRQVALLQILAQAGCFVPADEAELSLCDRIFTRVGASDDLAQGRSTFMVEMTETAHILKSATPDSLVLLDEIGRGTSTFDGLSIAWAVAEHLHEHVGARTLFATHYHELCDLEGALPRVRNVHVVVKEWNEEIIFTRTLAEGGAERSYGIQVARLAGLPRAVLTRAREVLAHLEGDVVAVADPERPAPRARRSARSDRPQMDLFTPKTPAPRAEELAAPPPSPLVEQLARLDVNRMTPLEALNTLAELVDDARKRVR